MLRNRELAWYYSSPLSLAGASLVQQRVLLAGSWPGQFIFLSPSSCQNVRLDAS
ncbi:hypothetical protein [Aureliella helgolandensis]|uniref:hypothetical protein n=1 Tax=Aureliella helgolandensis TaxID=2527968 RepID=UPI0018D15DB4|nr:hypothetical protein [Aureliella helgolandensis]